MAAAGAAGELLEYGPKHRNRCLFAHHLACMIAVMHLPSRPVIDYETAREELLDEAVRLQADAVMVHHGYFWKNESPLFVSLA